MEYNNSLEMTLFFISAIIISLVVNKLVLSFARTLGIRNKNDILVRWSSASKPSLGGISLYFTFMIMVVLYATIFSAENIFANLELIGLLAAGTLAFAIGLADDAYDTKPLLKLIGQISCGIILVFTENSIQLFHIEGIDAMITILFIVAVMNSLNMLDNMDGITGTVSLFILITCFVIVLLGIYPNPLMWGVLLAVEMGALIGFLFYNINPSKTFMGDSGSQFIALFVGYFGIKMLWNLPFYYELPSWIGILLVLTAFTPTIEDTLTVVINRTKRGVSVMVGGKDHSTHHLVYRGFSDKQVWYVFVVLGILSFSFTSLLAFMAINGFYQYSLLGIPFFLMIFIPLYRNTLKYKAPKMDGHFNLKNYQQRKIRNSSQQRKKTSRRSKAFKI